MFVKIDYNEQHSSMATLECLVFVLDSSKQTYASNVIM